MRPCPFCGQRPTKLPERLGTEHWAVWCSCCEYYGPRGMTAIMAAQSWACRPEEVRPDPICQALNEGDGVYRP
jgi:hypothetical protein